MIKSSSSYSHLTDEKEFGLKQAFLHSSSPNHDPILTNLEPEIYQLEPNQTNCGDHMENNSKMEGEPRESGVVEATSVTVAASYMQSCPEPASDECLSHAIQIFQGSVGHIYDKSDFVKPKKLKGILEQVKKCQLNQWKRTKNFGHLKPADLESALDSLSKLYMSRNVLNKISRDSTRTPAIGIQLGEQNCLISVFHQGQVHIIPNMDGGALKTPSYVSFNPDGSETFGQQAKENAWKNPANTIYDLTRLIGRKFSNTDFQDEMKSLPFIFQEDGDVLKIVVNGKPLQPEEILGKLLAYFRGMVENYLQLQPGTVTKAVITTPANFSNLRKQGLRTAGELAGFEEIKILMDSKVTPIPYYSEMEIPNMGNVLVYDFGANSVTLTLLDMESEKILSVREATDMGGVYITKKMVEYCASRFQAEHGSDLFDRQNSSHKQVRDDATRRLKRLNDHCEMAKIKLTTENSARVSVDGITQDMDLNVEVTRELFEGLNQIDFDRSVGLIADILNAAGLEKKDISAVVLVGGSSKIPKIHELLQTYFGKAILKKSINPELVVAHGAAFAAASMNVHDKDVHDWGKREDFIKPKIAEISKVVAQQFKIINANIFISNCEMEYNRAMEVEASNLWTVQALQDGHTRTMSGLLDCMTRMCPFGDDFTRRKYYRKLQDAIGPIFDRLQRSFKLNRLTGSNRLKKLKEENDSVLHRMSAKIEEQVKSKMTSQAAEWLRDHLTPDNISDVKNLYDHLSSNILGGMDNTTTTTEISLWGEIQQIIKEECKQSYTDYLYVVHEKLLMFYLAIKDKFISQSCFTSDNLEECFRDESGKVIGVSITDNSEICQLVKAGCEKLMDFFRDQNKEIVQSEELIAGNLIPQVLNFYDEEMQVYLREDVYPPDQLKGKHSSLVTQLVRAVNFSLKLGPGGKICENVKPKLFTLEEKLGQNFWVFADKNQTMSAKVEEEIRAILELSKTGYVSRIDDLLEKNSNGMNEAELADKHAQIKMKRLELLKVEIERKTGQEVQVKANLALLETYIDEYWTFSSQLNSMNLKISELIKLKEKKKAAPVGRHQQNCSNLEEESTGAAETRANDSLRASRLEVDIPFPSANQELLDKSNEIKNQLDGGLVFKFKSGVVKGMFVKIIEGAINCAQNPDSTKEQIEGRMDELERWSSKYKK